MIAWTPDPATSEGKARAYGAAWRRQRMAAGHCVACNGPSRQKPDGTHTYLCQGCADAAVIRQRAHYQSLKAGGRPSPRSRAGQTWCLRCDGLFPSPDVVRVRICNTCRPSQESMIERGADEEGWAIE